MKQNNNKGIHFYEESRSMSVLQEVFVEPGTNTVRGGKTDKLSLQGKFF
jgi:hypothetical protein